MRNRFGRASLILAGGAATGASILDIFLLWSFVPSRAALFACTVEPVSVSTRGAIYLSYLFVRYLPFMVVFGWPILGVACAGVLVAIVIAPDHRTYARRVMLGLVGMACVGLALAGLIWFAMTPLPHSLQPRCWGNA